MLQISTDSKSSGVSMLYTWRQTNLIHTECPFSIQTSWGEGSSRGVELLLLHWASISVFMRNNGGALVKLCVEDWIIFYVILLSKPQMTQIHPCHTNKVNVKRLGFLELHHSVVRGCWSTQHQSVISCLTAAQLTDLRVNEVRTILRRTQSVASIHYSDAVTQRHSQHRNAYEVRTAWDNGFNLSGWLSTISPIVFRRV